MPLDWTVLGRQVGRGRGGAVSRRVSRDSPGSLACSSGRLRFVLFLSSRYLQDISSKPIPFHKNLNASTREGPLVRIKHDGVLGELRAYHDVVVRTDSIIRKHKGWA